jgi:hypothetical protein
MWKEEHRERQARVTAKTKRATRNHTQTAFASGIAEIGCQKEKKLRRRSH